MDAERDREKREHEKERKKEGLPPLKENSLSSEFCKVCCTCTVCSIALHNPLPKCSFLY